MSEIPDREHLETSLSRGPFGRLLRNGYNRKRMQSLRNCRRRWAGWGMGALTPGQPIPPSRRPNGNGRPHVDNRLALNAMLWVLCSGARWQDLPDVKVMTH
ncbi:transposase [bacterium]|nr:transposase [bacterium]